LRSGPTKVKGLNLNLGTSCRSRPPALDPPVSLLPARILSPPDRRPRLRAAVLARATVDVSGHNLLGSPTPGPPSTSQAATSSGPRRPSHHRRLRPPPPRVLDAWATADVSGRHLLGSPTPGRPPPLATMSRCLARSSTTAAKTTPVDDCPAAPPVSWARAAPARVPARCELPRPASCCRPPRHRR
jgi:hypothetical protein